MRRSFLVVVCAVLCAAGVASAQTSALPQNPEVTGEIAGVVSRCGQQAITGMTVHIPGESFEAHLAANGSFRLRYVPPGTHTLVFELSGQPFHTVGNVTVQAKRVTDLGAIVICRDRDNDGATEDVDCNDNNPAIRPGAVEACGDGLDNNCNGTVDEQCAVCTDADLDGFFAQAGCNTAVDCNDQSASIKPGAVDACDGLDNNCNGQTDEAPNSCGAGLVCTAGACVPTACNPGTASCDLNPANGCEVNLLTDVNNCGGCGLFCNSANGTPACVNGLCTIGSCNPGFADCNAGPGCETNISNNLNNCGACGNVCNLPNANETCSAGACAIASCQAGFASCDGNAANGCELQNSGYVSTAPSNLGAFEADASGCNLAATVTGTRGRLFTVTATEGDSGLFSLVPLTLRFVLNVPGDIDYDLQVIATGADTCLGPTGCTSTSGAGGTEDISVSEGDDFGTQNTFSATVDVKFFNGSSCQPWTLQVFRGRSCQ
jgi:hypothetical protein